MKHQNAIAPLFIILLNLNVFSKDKGVKELIALRRHCLYAGYYSTENVFVKNFF